jgi:nucleoid-associated protein YgaU
MTVITQHTVTQGERLDNITARYLGDPEQFWQICDANNEMRPDDLTKEIGSIIRISMPKVG